MGVIVDETKNPVLMEWRRKAVAQGRAEGKSELVEMQRKQRFGTLPKWALDRVAGARTAQLDRWAKKVLTAKTLEDVIGSRI